MFINPDYLNNSFFATKNNENILKFDSNHNQRMMSNASISEVKLTISKNFFSSEH